LYEYEIAREVGLSLRALLRRAVTARSKDREKHERAHRRDPASERCG
jgi:hypothetical protein